MSDSDEELDEADEDSNGKFPYSLKNKAVHILFLAEEYYKNDYPEEENSGRNICLTITHRSPDSIIFEDEFHESSEHDDVVHYLEDLDDQDF
jgi:hypothetical protein